MWSFIKGAAFVAVVYWLLGGHFAWTGPLPPTDRASLVVACLALGFVVVARTLTDSAIA
jgi:hypothetical protein